MKYSNLESEDNVANYGRLKEIARVETKNTFKLRRPEGHQLIKDGEKTLRRKKEE